MRIGATVPQTDLGADPGAQRAYAEAAEALGYTHLLAYDHVLGADPDVHQGWEGRYDIDTTFHEPLVLFGYLAAITHLELVTGVVILPQRQSVLVAKQAAEVDILTDGRFRLGVGLGWNHVEYEALGKEMSGRGKRFEEQLTLMRRLWTERVCHLPGSMGGSDRCRTGATPGAAAHPDLVRSPHAPGVPEGGAAGGRMVPAGAARPRAR